MNISPNKRHGGGERLRHGVDDFVIHHLRRNIELAEKRRSVKLA